ncbi:MAG: DUF1501 domain-containing protein [Pirellulaceae bacterium]|jgi:hypothetical protein
MTGKRMQEIEPSDAMRSCRGPMRRRAFLELGGLGIGGLGLADLLRAQDASRDAGKPLKDRAVIFIWLPGGPPHMETYDMKPGAPVEYRGLFRPIKTNVSGIDLCELLPMHARCADKYTIIRSCHHQFSDHGGGHKRFLTGRIPASPVDFVNDSPSVLSVAQKMLSRPREPLPACIAGVDGGRGGVDTFSFGSAYLGPAHIPFIVDADPNAADFQVRNIGITPEMEHRLADRLELLQGLDRFRREIDSSGIMEAMDSFGQRALTMLTSQQVRDAFDLTREPDAVRDRYGRHTYGQRGLLARRLVEAGSRFVTMVWENPNDPRGMPKNCTYNWDSHAVNCDLFADSRWRFPYYDQALTALIEDLYQRGLDRDVLLIATGEFGRTPRINETKGSQTGVMQPGRDHWPDAMSMLISGGGIRTGQVIGATNARGEHPVERPLSPNDLWATVYRFLGINYEESFLDHQGRPMPILPFGEPIRELIS